MLRRVIDLMAERDVTSAKLPEIGRMARGEPGGDPGPGVARCATPPRGVLQGRGHRHADPLHQQQPPMVTVRPDLSWSRTGLGVPPWRTILTPGAGKTFLKQLRPE